MKLFVLALSLVGSSDVAPIVIVPGDGSNQLEARLNKPEAVSWRCEKTSDWFRLWLELSDLLAATDCWSDNIKLIYDEATDTLTNNVGVETRVPDFGGTSSFEELDPSVPFHATAAFSAMVQRLVSHGFERNVTLRGAPYDFRYAPSSSVGAQYIQDLKDLIEQTVNATGKRARLISHSMGCLQTLYLLNHQSQAWKDKFVEKWIPLAGPFGGAAKEMRLFASGDNEGLPVSSLNVREEQRSYETNFWLAPVSKLFGDEVLVTTLTQNYTAKDYDVFFSDIGYSAGQKLIKRVMPLTSEALAPGVDVVCMHSYGVPTPLHFTYDKNGFDQTPEIVNGDGDGTVNRVSLRLCDQWSSKQTQSVKVVTFENVTHSGMLTDESVLKALLNELELSTHKGGEVIV